MRGRKPHLLTNTAHYTTLQPWDPQTPSLTHTTTEFHLECSSLPPLPLPLGSPPTTHHSHSTHSLRHLWTIYVYIASKLPGTVRRTTYQRTDQHRHRPKPICGGDKKMLMMRGLSCSLTRLPRNHVEMECAAGPYNLGSPSP
ncbi:hypothetical protein JAAARDRAFT_254458 [Jaapia argillacea MUCL 33604]|uniref:Uncharacterized protein n=1 Tax=Jaapia argillacea MUCL 33604 TaxID=933084 RepID=A0A067PTG1_9AGAM|nr:hypothetical protein JAAARDRAFT_254458 [Jaapia argillacea MUCL 33604]